MQLEMIGKMLKKGDTYITLTFDEGIGASHNGVFSLTRDTDDDLMELARELSVAIEAPVFTKHPGRFQTNPELGHIEKEFYAYPSQEWPEVPQFLRIRRCQDLYEEVEYVAKDILKRVGRRPALWGGGHPASEHGGLSGHLEVRGRRIRHPGVH